MLHWRGDGGKRATIERGDERSAFSLELFDLQTWTLRPLASTLNFQWRPDPVLVRFIARGIVLQLIGVAAFKFFHLERGYWFPWTMLVVLQPEFGATRLRAGQRVFGTLAGGIAASLLLFLSLPPIFLLIAMAVTVGLFSFWLKRQLRDLGFFHLDFRGIDHRDFHPHHGRLYPRTTRRHRGWWCTRVAGSIPVLAGMGTRAPARVARDRTSGQSRNTLSRSDSV